MTETELQAPGPADGAPSPRDPAVRTTAALLAIVALVGSLYLARGFFVPLLIGILASYSLHPLVDWLERFRLPRSVAAALILASVVGSLCWLGFSMSGDAAVLIERLPEAARRLRSDLKIARVGTPTALQNMQEAASELQGAAADASAQPGERVTARRTARGANSATAPPLPAPEPTWLREYMYAQSALLVSVAAQAPIVLLLTYFLLASGAHFRRKLIRLVGPSLTRKKDAVRILEEIDVQVQRYLLAMLASNILIGLGTWVAFLALGLDHAGVWGTAAGVLHFVPYLGSTLIALGSAVAALLQFGSPFHAFAAACLSLLVSGAIGLVFMTWLHGRLARVNAAVLFIALLFFGWLWGVCGLLLGAPLIAIAKVVFDRVDALKPLGELLGH